MCVEKGHFLQLGANVLVEFKNVILIGGIFYYWGQLGVNMLVESNFFCFSNWGDFSPQLGANLLVAYEFFFK